MTSTAMSFSFPTGAARGSRRVDDKRRKCVKISARGDYSSRKALSLAMINWASQIVDSKILVFSEKNSDVVVVVDNV